MNLNERISALQALGQKLSLAQDDQGFSVSIHKAEAKNPWFTQENILTTIHEISEFLQAGSFQVYADLFKNNIDNKSIAVIPSGKAPCDLWFDMITIVLSGNTLIVKLAEKDTILPKYVFDTLVSIEPTFKEKIYVCGGFLPHFDAYICKKENTQFQHYFSHCQSLIHHDKTSVVILNGDESAETLVQLGKEIFSLFGMSCRNVTKVFVPQNYDLKKFLDALDSYSIISMHYKYMNNYEYQKSIYLLSQKEHLDTGFLLVKHDESLFPPTGVIFYERYTDVSDLQQIIEKQKNRISRVIGEMPCCNTDFSEMQKFSFNNDVDCNETITFIRNLK